MTKTNGSPTGASSLLDFQNLRTPPSSYSGGVSVLSLPSVNTHPRLRRHSKLWWVLLVAFLVFGVPRVYDTVSRLYRESSLEKRKIATARHQLEAMGRALEAYKGQYGNYPGPLNGATDPVTEARMLYQAVTGDGTDMIDGAESKASDGEPGTEGMAFTGPWFVSEEELRKMVHPGLYLVDPWGNPYRYRRGDSGPATKNRWTFDLWSSQRAKANGEPLWLANWPEAME